MRSPVRPSVVKGRHSITRSRSGGELASLHLSSSNGPSTGYQGRRTLNKGALRAGMKAISHSEPPSYAHRGYRVIGVPGKNGFHWMHFCTRWYYLNAKCVFWRVLICCRLRLSYTSHSWVQSCECVVCSVAYVNACTCVWKFKGVEGGVWFADIMWQCDGLERIQSAAGMFFSWRLFCRYSASFRS